MDQKMNFSSSGASKHMGGSLMIFGITFEIFGLLGLVANLLVGIGVLCKNLLSRSSPVIYRPMFSLLVADSVQLAIFVGYLAPSMILQRHLLGQKGMWLSGFIFLWMWREMWLMLSLVALNRYFSVCHIKSYMKTFSAAHLNVLIGLSWPVSLLVTLIAHWTLPCCRFVFSYPDHGYTYLTNRNHTTLGITVLHSSAIPFNYTDTLIQWPGNVLTSVIIVFCYSKIVMKQRNINQKVHSNFNLIKIMPRENYPCLFGLG